MIDVSKNVCVALGEFPDEAVNRGICTYSREHGPWRIHTVLALNLAKAAPAWLANHYDGLIAVGLHDESVLDRLRKGRRPVVCVLAPTRPAGPGAYVTPDDFAIGRLAGEHLLSCGYRNLGFYGASGDWCSQRYDGFRATVLRHRAALVTNMLSDQETWPWWPEAAEGDAPAAFLKALPKPVAVFACDDAMAKTLADCCIRLGLRVPEQVAILGVNNRLEQCESSTLTLSSVDPNLEQLGYEAGLLLDRMLASGSLDGPTVQVRPLKVVERRSTNPVAFEDADLAAALQYIRKNACTSIDVTSICRRVSVSRRVLEKKFKQSLGRSPGEEIRQIRISHACELLAGTDMPTSVVALNCGYAYSQSFCAAFRAVTKMTPRQYRKIHAHLAKARRPGSRPIRTGER